MSNDERIQTWVEAARRGDEQGFLSIYRFYSGKVRGVLRQMLGAEGLDDSVQEVFLRVWKGLSSLREPSAFSSWIYRTTWNVAMDSRKSAALRRTQADEFIQQAQLGRREHSPEKAMDA
ncbi:MAG: sigma-70 family RNA polymerase sigma factor [Betaproteobacteria bacterium]|nr:sigma-70 family RNA polymerase sigma factor [Betaproteobacteria bacterium]